jgi:hypothetical protein
MLAMTLLCLGFGSLFLFLSADPLGWIFIAVGVGSEALCLYLGNRRCQRRYISRQLTG